MRGVGLDRRPRAVPRAAGDAQGRSDAAGEFDDPLSELSDGLVEAADKLGTATDGLVTKLTDYEPFSGVSFGRTSTYAVRIPLGSYVVNQNLDTGSPPFVLIRLVELFLLSIIGVRMFFNIIKI